MAMATGQGLILLLLLVLQCLVAVLGTVNRSSFPAGFVFGTASSAYQYEGAANEGGRAPSIWDTFALKRPDKIKDRSSGIVAADSYHRYKEDVALMKDIGFDAYRFSISWSRLLPRGNLNGGVNQEGIAYYNDLINELLANGVQPYITLFHWDVPQALEDQYGGFLSPKIVNDFKDYAELCYEEFGDRVKNWVTINEPQTIANNGYGTGTFAPGRCSSCGAGDSGREPYIVGHHMLLAHAAAVKLYRDKYQVFQKGQIGIVLNSGWVIPFSNSKADEMAASRALAFAYDWYLEPLKSGSYPAEMVKRLGERLPQFTKEQAEMVKGSYDILGINYYSSNYATDVPCPTNNFTYSTDSCAKSSNERNGILIGPQAASDWLNIYPRGIQDLLVYTKNKMNNPILYVTENGVDEHNNGSVIYDDTMRINYHRDHLACIHTAMKEHGVNVKGYFAWSLLDNFEWADGYTVSFGLVYVDFKKDQKRYPKASAKWFNQFLQQKPTTTLPA